MADRMLQRFAFQQVILSCMADLNLDAFGDQRTGGLHDRGDRVPDPQSPDGTRLVGPVPARLPVGVDFAARPFGEPTLIRIASAFEKAAKHREPPPEFSGILKE
jgi:hypothetical protein